MRQNSLRGATQMLFDFAESAIESAAAAFDQLTRGIAHALHLFVILEEMNHLDAGILRIADLNRGTGFDETGSNLREIFHGVAEDGNFSERGRLENIVATGSDQRTSNKNAVGKFVERSEFADAVEEENVASAGISLGTGIAGEAWARDGELGTANEFAVGLIDECGGSGETFGLARSEDK